MVTSIDRVVGEGREGHVEPAGLGLRLARGRDGDDVTELAGGEQAATLRTAQIAVEPVPSPTTIPDVRKLVACSAAARFRRSRSST